MNLILVTKYHSISSVILVLFSSSARRPGPDPLPISASVMEHGRPSFSEVLARGPDVIPVGDPEVIPVGESKVVSVWGSVVIPIGGPVVVPVSVSVVIPVRVSVILSWRLVLVIVGRPVLVPVRG